jgi:hypothetical protein
MRLIYNEIWLKWLLWIRRSYSYQKKTLKGDIQLGDWMAEEIKIYWERQMHSVFLKLYRTTFFKKIHKFWVKCASIPASSKLWSNLLHPCSFFRRYFTLCCCKLLLTLIPRSHYFLWFDKNFLLLDRGMSKIWTSLTQYNFKWYRINRNDIVHAIKKK